MCGCVIYLFVFSINLDISKIYHVLISLLRIAVLFDAYIQAEGLFIGKFDFLCYMSGRGCICPFYNRGMTSFATFQCLSLTQLKMPLFLVDEKVLYPFRVNVIEGDVRGVRKPQNRTETRQKTANRIGFFPEYRNRAYM